MIPNPPAVSFFFFNDTATTEIYTLSLHDALPISSTAPTLHDRTCNTRTGPHKRARSSAKKEARPTRARGHRPRSEEHTSELQSRLHLVCRLLLEKKKTTPKCFVHDAVALELSIAP